MTLDHATASRQTRVRLNPAKLRLSKWTAVAPRAREKHFIVTRVIQPEPPTQRIEFVELEAVYTRRAFVLRWCELTDAGQWLQGWR